jgi:hypothetical protein
MAWSDYKICDLCGDAKVFYDANILDERYCATWGEPSDYDPIGLKAICGKCNKTHEVVIAPRATLAAIEVPEALYALSWAKAALAERGVDAPPVDRALAALAEIKGESHE